MALYKREKMIENLAIAAALGFLALMVAAISLAADSRVVAEERSVLPGGVAVAGRADDPSFDRFYRFQSAAGPAYLAVIILRSPSGAALVAATYSPKGELQELRFLGSCATRLPTNARDLISAFPGADEAIGRAGEFSRRLAAGNSEGRL